MKKVTNLFFILLGFIALGLGTIGIILPALPTTPFFLLTCFCFAKGSIRFHDWFLNTRLYKKHLEAYIKTRAMSLKMKLRLCIPASILMIVSFIFAPSLIVRVIILCALIFMVCYFTFRIKTLPEKNAE